MLTHPTPAKPHNFTSTSYRSRAIAAGVCLGGGPCRWRINTTESPSIIMPSRRECVCCPMPHTRPFNTTRHELACLLKAAVALVAALCLAIEWVPLFLNCVRQGTSKARLPSFSTKRRRTTCRCYLELWLPDNARKHPNHPFSSFASGLCRVIEPSYPRKAHKSS